MPGFTESLCRLQDLLEHSPPVADGRTLVPLGTLVDVMQQCAGVLRSKGNGFEADQLEAVVRGYLARPPRRTVVQQALDARTADNASRYVFNASGYVFNCSTRDVLPGQPRRRPVPGRRAA